MCKNMQESQVLDLTQYKVDRYDTGHWNFQWAKSYLHAGTVSASIWLILGYFRNRIWLASMSVLQMAVSLRIQTVSYFRKIYTEIHVICRNFSEDF